MGSEKRERGLWEQGAKRVCTCLLPACGHNEAPERRLRGWPDLKGPSLIGSRRGSPTPWHCGIILGRLAGRGGKPPKGQSLSFPVSPVE